MAVDFLMDELFERAGAKYLKTQQYLLSREKMEQIEQDCYGMLKKEERIFAEECFELILDAEEQKAQFLYQEGLFDGIKLVKYLKLLV